MLKRVLCLFFISAILLSGCGANGDEEEQVFSISQEQQEKYSQMIEEKLNSFYWHYDDTSLAYYDSKVPENREDNKALFEASQESGVDMTKYAGREAVCFTASLNHVNGEGAGIAYFYFVNDNLAGIYYTPQVNGTKTVGLNTRNVFKPSADIKNIESDNEYNLEHTSRRITVLADGFDDEYRNDNGSFFAETVPNGVNIYRYSKGSIRRYRTISSSALEGLRPISAAFLSDGGLAVIAGNSFGGIEEIENERVLSEKVIFFDSNFNKQNQYIDLENGRYSCVASDGEGFVLINDKTMEFYESAEGQWTKYASYYTNIQASDFKQADIDGDGEKEYIVTDNRDLFVFRKSNVGMNCIWRTNLSADCYYGYIYTGDLNDDGTEEIYICDATGTIIRYVIGENGLVTRNEDISYGQRIYAGDFNNDGKDDYIFSDGESCTLYVRN